MYHHITYITTHKLLIKRRLLRDGKLERTQEKKNLEKGLINDISSFPNKKRKLN
jgi:hypothetical protein